MIQKKNETQSFDIKLKYRHRNTIKAHKQSLRKRARNSIVKSRVKNSIKKVILLLEKKELDLLRPAFSQAQSLISKAVTKGILKLNTASRKISRLNAKIEKINL